MPKRYNFVVESPVGRLFLAKDGEALTDLRFHAKMTPDERRNDWTTSEAPFRDVIRQLKAYFKGDLKRFDLPLKPEGTPFQEKVWQALVDIPYGETITYKELARRVGKPNACRAVGAANGQNPLSIVIPCHRVIGSGGRLTGYGGGLDVKRFLLALEGALFKA